MNTQQPGDLVLDLGCRLAEAMGEQPQLGRVVAVFPWGLRLANPEDPADEWDSERWVSATPAGGASLTLPHRVTPGTPLRG